MAIIHMIEELLDNMYFLLVLFILDLVVMLSLILYGRNQMKKAGLYDKDREEDIDERNN